MKHYQRVLLFLGVNFLALGLGSLLQGEGPDGAWYQALNKAPWTPPGWVFGAAWTIVMICFSFFVATWCKVEKRKKIILFFSMQFILNVIWNMIFFKFHMIALALAVIVALTLLITYFFIRYAKEMKANAILIMPYFIWLCIATSLNAYAFLNN